ncbi:DUF6264 family protein [Leifsonia sp. F6_8S_P_1B]|uniref:DUF6264 family protein n=1 Tax=Leifsonia williamsii TaxID=3035919 RepID=A0ABT8KFK7_9MICO|nr:DUF6264 family protein [Leifsonia williamsii]MDN4615793.1 DUF6264 family protein [Leifsonia williamsii]
MAEQHPQPDERPRPKYGELAPPGWTWTPPADADRLDTSRTSPAASGAEESPVEHQAPPPHAYQAPPGGVLQQPRATSRWDLPLTVLLLVFGFFGLSYSIGILQAFPAYLQLLHSSQGLGDYTPEPVVGTIVTIGTITMAGLWAVSTGLSVWLLVRKRVAFYVPLITGVIAFIALIVFASLMVSTDPALLDVYGGFSPPPAPSTP